jgi:RNA recognition motif-containing protein
VSPQEKPRQIFIGNVAFNAIESDIAHALEDAHIFVHRVRIVTDKATQRSRGFAFIDIDFEDPKSVEEIIALINQGNIYVRNRALRADQAVQRSRDDQGTHKGSQNRDRSGRGHERNEVTRSRNEFDNGIWDD